MSCSLARCNSADCCSRRLAHGRKGSFLDIEVVKPPRCPVRRAIAPETLPGVRRNAANHPDFLQPASFAASECLASRRSSASDLNEDYSLKARFSLPRLRRGSAALWSHCRRMCRPLWSLRSAATLLTRPLLVLGGSKSRRIHCRDARYCPTEAVWKWLPAIRRRVGPRLRVLRPRAACPHAWWKTRRPFATLPVPGLPAG